MGVNFTYLAECIHRKVHFRELASKTIGIDGYQGVLTFLKQIQVKGKPFTDEVGHVTSHLIGLLNQCVQLLSHKVTPLFIFDVQPPAIELSLASQLRAHAEQPEEEPSPLCSTDQLVEDTFTLLDCFGVPYIIAPGAAQAQGALMTKKDDLYTFISTDEVLLYGAPRVLRHVKGKKRGTGKNKRDYYYELTLQRLITALAISHEQLILLGLLTGTKYNPGTKGLSPRVALELVQQYPTLDTLIPFLQRPHLKLRGTPVVFDDVFPLEPEVLCNAFLQPRATEDYQISVRRPNLQELLHFLCVDRNFDQERVESSLKKLTMPHQTTLENFIR